ncbi:unnamed protein product [Alopecurus aequalis]
MDSTSTTAPDSGVTATLAPTARPWAHLSPDLLLDVSNRFDDAADFVRFHAACAPWRRAAPALHSPAATRPAFSPWLLAPCGSHVMHSTVDLGRVSSLKEEAIDSYGYGDGVLAEPTATSPSTAGGGGRSWVASADGTAAWFFIPSPKPRLVHLLTGAVTLLPHFPNDILHNMMENVGGIVYGDGTVFMYNFLYEKNKSKFTAAILRRGATAWKVMRGIWEVPTTLSSATYHDGTVLVSFSDYFWSVLTRAGLNHVAGLQSRWSGIEESKYSREGNYVLESRGELLWASVLVEREWLRGYARADLTSVLSVSVHALENGAGGVMRWAARDGWSLADRVLFLGSPASFAVDAQQLVVGGGCAYFVYRRCVFRYSFIDGETELVRRLPRGWGNDDGATGVWVWPQPTIASIQEIRRRTEQEAKKYVTSWMY